MKGNSKMEIITAIISAIISAALTFVILTILNCNSKAKEIGELRSEYEKEIQEERLKNARYCISNFLYADRNKALNNQLSEKDKEIERLKYQLKAAENVINAIDNELSGNTSYSKERLPKGHTNMFMGMPYDLITDKNSDQYALRRECATDIPTGIRVYYDGKKYYYCAALAGAYGTDIGDTWHVTLKNGLGFNLILADYKHPIDNPDPNDFGDPCKNYDGEDCTNVIEFVFDGDYLPREVLIAGTFSKLTFFGGLYGDGGNIVKMEYTGRVWKR